MGVIRRTVTYVAVITVLVMATASMASADGTETLGAPSIPIATGSGIAAGGVGLELAQPANINVAVPGGATINQVLLYWEGQSSTAAGGDDSVTVDGNAVTGALIGGPTFFFTNPQGDHYSFTYRADITGLGLVTDGANSLSVGGLDFDQLNDGAGVLVIYDDGTTAEIGLVDGNDLAFVNFDPPLDGTVAQTFSFAAESAVRTADLTMFFSSVEGQVFPGDRPSTIEVVVDGTTTEFINVLSSFDGDEWDTFTAAVSIPAGATSATVQVFSDDRLGTGNRPASLAWNAAALVVPTTPPPPGGGEGCTPGYWKQKHHFDSWVGFSPGDDYEDIFGVDANFKAESLLKVLKQGGGKEKALGRHAVAALLNSSTGDVDYAFTTAEVIALVQDAYSSGDFNGVKNVLEDENESGCPLN